MILATERKKMIKNIWIKIEVEGEIEIERWEIVVMKFPRKKPKYFVFIFLTLF